MFTSEAFGRSFRNHDSILETSIEVRHDGGVQIAPDLQHSTLREIVICQQLTLFP